MTKQKRFESELDIRVEITKARLRARNLTVTAEAIEKMVVELVRKSNAPLLPANEVEYWKEQANFERCKARKILRTAQLLEESRIPALIRTLAAFKTQTMPIIADKGVVMEAT